MELSSLNDAFLDVLVESGTRQEVQFRRIQHRCTPSATVAQTVAPTESYPKETHPERYLIKLALRIKVANQGTTQLPDTSAFLVTIGEISHNRTSGP
jgi:hypothetical protein